MSCVRESSPQSEHVATPRPESKRTWNPLRGLRRMFRRHKQPSPEPNEVKLEDDIIEPPSLDTSKSRSTSQLIDEPFSRSRNLHSTLKSVSHDSVFNPEQHPGQSDSESAVSIPQMVFPQANIQAELQEKLRRRRKIQNDDDSDDADDGLPRSPSMHSPIIATGNDLLLSKELITKSSHSTCSDGSLLSMDSSEMDEDSLGAHNSRYSSRISLHDRRPPQNHHQESSDGDSSTSVPLSHSAAKHRMAIRPKRNPRSKKPLTATNALPATPEVNEEHSGRSTSPEAKPRTAADTSDGTTNATSTTTSTTIITTNTTITNTITTTTATLTATTTTPDVDASDTCTAVSMVSTCDLDASIDEISVENVPRREEGFFHRLLSRRSTKKKAKSPSMEEVDVDRFLFDENTGAKPRQREEPPPAGRMQLSYPPDLPPDHQPQSQNYLHCGQNVSMVEDIFEPDTFTPIKQPFSLGQQMIDDDTASSSGGGSSVQKSLSSDSVSSTVLDESVSNVVEHEITSERCRSYSSSDSDHQGNNGYQRPLPVPAPRFSKLHNGCGSGVGSVDVVVRRKKRDDQQSELLKVFARRSLKLGQDGEPELLILPGGGDDGNVVHQQENQCSLEETNITVSENEAVATVLQLVDDKKNQSDPEVDVNENQTLTDVPRFKRIQQRREEWEKRLLQQQQN